jgi:hypothetical protein
MRNVGLVGLCAVLCVIQWVARYAAAPVADFTLDDWALLERAEAMHSWTDAFGMMIREPDRPVGAFLLAVVFRAFGEHLLWYHVLSMFMTSVAMLLVIGMVWHIFPNKKWIMAVGVLFGTFPNLTESYNWPTMIAYLPGIVAIPGSAYCFAVYLHGSRARYLFCSLLLFAIGLGTYEFGILLPLAYACLAYACHRPARSFRWILFYGAIILVYLVWRFTSGFGMAHGVLFESRSPSVSLYSLHYNARSIVSWWMGDHMLGALQSGLSGFLSLSLWERRIFYLVNVTLCGIVVYLWGRFDKDAEPDSFQAPRFVWGVVLFGVVWAVLAHAPSLVAWTAGRLNYIPAIGVAVMGGLCIARSSRAGLIVLIIAMYFGLLAGQGTARQWKDAGRMNRLLEQALRNEQQNWAKKEVVWLDTRSLRSRLSSHLNEKNPVQEKTWAYYGNAGLLRGFAPAAMVRRIRGKDDMPKVLLDVEHGALTVEGGLQWHDRYAPDGAHHITPMDEVYRIDVLEVFLAE